MSEQTNSDQPSGWRIPKACQECRKRKIRCNGVNPCKTCQLRNTPCVYRDIVRQRKKKQKNEREDSVGEVHASQETVASDHGGGQPSPGLPQPGGHRNQSASYTFNNSVSATHMASPSCKIQLYYGPTSHFTLMHEMYRGLVSNRAGRSKEPEGEVEEAGAGLDMFSYRNIFFGTPAETYGTTQNLGAPTESLMFLPYELARVFLQRFLSSIYALVPFQPKQSYEQQLDQLYSPCPDSSSDNCARCILLMFMAMGAASTPHHHWADILFERVKAASSSLDDVVNLDTVQLALMMHAHYQTEQGRPNSSFLYLGTAARKAISAGLHKESPAEERGNVEGVERRRVVFWSLYFYETWICFHLGRPSSLSATDAGIAPPQDPFLLVLIHLSKVMSRSANEIYRRPHDSLLQMWKVARSISDDLRCHDAKMRQALGFGLDKCAQPGHIGVRQAILTILYYHTILLTFRPFLIFRGRWRRDAQAPTAQAGNNTSKRPTEMPTWLNEACEHAINAACRTLHHLCEAAIVNEVVRELRYHAFFITSSCFALIYDFMCNDKVAAQHLPWVHVGLQCLGAMRPDGPITSSISAIQTVLRKIHPSYEWSPASRNTQRSYNPEYTHSSSAPPYSGNMNSGMIMAPRQHLPPEGWMGAILPVLPSMQGYPLPSDIPEAAASTGSSEDLPDFTLSDMGWDFDFSTMDLEAFFSIQSNIHPPQAISFNGT